MRGAKPVRIEQRRRKGWRLPAGAIVVSRPSRWGNPFDWRQGCEKGGEAWAKGQAVKLFREWLRGRHKHKGTPPTLAEIREQLAGHDLACWCGPEDTCHADVLLELANG